MMEMEDSPHAVICKLCGDVYRLIEDGVDANLPRVLLCGHIFCTNCLLTIQWESGVICPDCELESTLPETGVLGLQEESRIIGLIYTARINKQKIPRCDRSKVYRRNRQAPPVEMNTNPGDGQQPADVGKVVDEALAQAADTLAQLEHIHETLKAGVAEQAKRERDRLEKQIQQASFKAIKAVKKWKTVQLSKLEVQFSTCHDVAPKVQERIKELEMTIQMAREVRRIPSLGQYCILDKVIQTLQAPAGDYSDVKHIAAVTGMSCVFQEESLNQSLVLSLKMEVSSSSHLSKSTLKSLSAGTPSCPPPLKEAQDIRSSSLLPVRNKLPGSQRQSSGTSSASPSSPSSRQISLSSNSTTSDFAPDVIVEELLYEGQEHVTQWVEVTHIVNPSHFYVCYIAERKKEDGLSRKIDRLCSEDGSFFIQEDGVNSGSLVFVKWEDAQWCRTRVAEVFQRGRNEAVNTCPVTQLASLRVFYLDYGFTKNIPIQSEEGAANSSLKSLNKYLRKVSSAANVELRQYVPRAIRCSLKDLVPYDLAEGWSEKAKVEFQNMVSGKALIMQPLGKDGDSLLVDLRKVPMANSRKVSVSVREYLVFIEVASLYSSVKASMRPQMFCPPVYPTTNREVNAIVRHINDPSDFYIQLTNDMEASQLSVKLQDCYNRLAVLEDNELNIYCPVIGQACVARFERNIWYRAKIIGLPRTREVEVQYVDHGSKKVLSVNDLRKIKDEFLALPSKAIHCCLAEVVPVDGKNWSGACTNRFISLTNQQLVTMVVIGKVPRTEPLPVIMFEAGVGKQQSSIAELLVKEKLASFKDGMESQDPKSYGDCSAVWDPPLQFSSTAENSGDLDQITEEQKEKPELQYQLRLPAKLKDIEVSVTFATSPSSFYVQLKEYDSYQKRICELVKQECSQLEPKEDAWKADMYCAAHHNGVWERGQLCSDVTSSNIAEVRRCDYGSTVKLHINNLRPLPPSLTGSMALECTLTDIRPSGGRSAWTKTACDLFSYYLTGASAKMTIQEVTSKRPLPVTLFCLKSNGEFMSFADFLLSEGLALRDKKPRAAPNKKPEDTDAKTPVCKTQNDRKEESSPDVHLPPTYSSSLIPSLVPAEPAPQFTMPPEKVVTTLYQPPELPCLGHVRISVSAVGDDGVIYIMTQDAEHQLEQLKEKIQQSLKTLPTPKPYTWKSVQGCAVIGPDMSWYRGQLLELLGGHVKVQYVDLGLVECIPVVHVYPMLLCADVPQLCVPCQLLGIKPAGEKWQPDAVALIKNVLLHRSVAIQVVELPADPRAPLMVHVFLDGMSLSRILCHHEHASMDQTLSVSKEVKAEPPAPVLDDWDMNTKGLTPEEPLLGPFADPNLPQVGWCFQVQVKHLITPNELFLCFLEDDVLVDGETLDEALDRVNANIHSLPHLSSFPPGGACLAEYSDGHYYRAKLVKFASVEPVKILVQHVDFGSYDTLPPSKLLQMPTELLRFPPEAIKVKVVGFQAPSVNWHEDVLSYSPEWSVKALMEMVDLLHGSISATVVMNEPELKVRLYNQDGELVHLPLLNSRLADLA
ncbi:RING finger protein 17 isoform X2 [Nothobranchius furzeri]|uniref:RING finger protein 17 isoform X2 n=1 Tax=Nothobranchius furzeri TaxID=105023 RepID=UPI0024046D7D|nr:RING finger protein 17 isoform X2 [Nothobranchius furzeri]